MNLGDRLDLRVGSATSTPFADGSFDRVVALESALRFDTRRKFFEEAFRVLRPGGVLVQEVNDKVYEPNIEYMRKRRTDALRDPRFKSFSRQQTIKWYLKVTELRAALSDYIIAVAKKPGDNRRCDTAEG